MFLLLSRSFLYQSFVQYFLRNPSVLRTPLHTVCHTMCRLNFAIGSSFRSSEVRFEVRKFAAKFPPNFRTSKRNWELGNELRNRVLKSELKSTIITVILIVYVTQGLWLGKTRETQLRAILMFKSMNGLAPEYLRSKFVDHLWDTLSIYSLFLLPATVQKIPLLWCDDLEQFPLYV